MAVRAPKVEVCILKHLRESTRWHPCCYKDRRKATGQSSQENQELAGGSGDKPKNE